MIFFPNGKSKYFVWNNATEAERILVEDVFKTENDRYMNIHRSTRSVAMVTDANCGLCCEQLNDGLELKCKHYFHIDCFWTCMNKDEYYCPLCKCNVY